MVKDQKVLTETVTCFPCNSQLAACGNAMLLPSILLKNGEKMIDEITGTTEEKLRTLEDEIGKWIALEYAKEGQASPGIRHCIIKKTDTSRGLVELKELNYGEIKGKHKDELSNVKIVLRYGRPDVGVTPYKPGESDDTVAKLVFDNSIISRKFNPNKSTMTYHLKLGDSVAN